MKNTLAFLALCLTMVAFASSAKAQDSRLYFAGYLGLTTHTESEFNESSVPISGDLEMKHAISMAGALGVQLNYKWRVEAEISYQKADMDQIDFAGTTGSFNLGGDLGTYLYMINAYYDFDFEWAKLSPFLTAGFGLAQHDMEINDISGVAIDVVDDSLNFAWQLGGGLKYRVSDNLAFTGNYRWLDTTDLEIESYDVEYSGHEFRLGVEYDIPPDVFK